MTRVPHAALARTDHRPWPVPAGPWILSMVWEDLLFAHWALPPESVRPLVPPCLDLDLRDGFAWVGVVPFRMSGVRLRGTPALPGPGAFPELNLRTYVVAPGPGDAPRPGVWFWSLDAASRLAVRAARSWFHLPYFDAEMECSPRTQQGDGEVAYRSRRTHGGAPAAEFRATYAPAGPEFRAAEGSLERWLTERYCLYAADPRGGALRGEIQHGPWPLRAARADIDANTVASAAGLALPAHAPHLLFARRIDVVAWAPARVGGTGEATR